MDSKYKYPRLWKHYLKNKCCYITETSVSPNTDYVSFFMRKLFKTLNSMSSYRNKLNERCNFQVQIIWKLYDPIRSQGDILFHKSIISTRPKATRWNVILTDQLILSSWNVWNHNYIIAYIEVSCIVLYYSAYSLMNESHRQLAFNDLWNPFSIVVSLVCLTDRKIFRPDYNPYIKVQFCVYLFKKLWSH